MVFLVSLFSILFLNIDAFENQSKQPVTHILWSRPNVSTSSETDMENSRNFSSSSQIGGADSTVLSQESGMNSKQKFETHQNQEATPRMEKSSDNSKLLCCCLTYPLQCCLSLTFIAVSATANGCSSFYNRCTEKKS